METSAIPLETEYIKDYTYYFNECFTAFLVNEAVKEVLKSIDDRNDKQEYSTNCVRMVIDTSKPITYDMIMNTPHVDVEAEFQSRFIDKTNTKQKESN